MFRTRGDLKTIPITQMGEPAVEGRHLQLNQPAPEVLVAIAAISIPAPGIYRNRSLRSTRPSSAQSTGLSPYFRLCGKCSGCEHQVQKRRAGQTSADSNRQKLSFTRRGWMKEAAIHCDRTEWRTEFRGPTMYDAVFCATSRTTCLPCNILEEKYSLWPVRKARLAESDRRPDIGRTPETHTV